MHSWNDSERLAILYSERHMPTDEVTVRRKMREYESG